MNYPSVLIRHLFNFSVALVTKMAAKIGLPFWTKFKALGIVFFKELAISIDKKKLSVVIILIICQNILLVLGCALC